MRPWLIHKAMVELLTIDNDEKATLVLFLAITSISFGQKKWFSTYQDSIALVKDANAITQKFTSDLKKLILRYNLTSKPYSTLRPI